MYDGVHGVFTGAKDTPRFGRAQEPLPVSSRVAARHPETYTNTPFRPFPGKLLYIALSISLFYLYISLKQGK